jgi:hypothetical protein
MEGKRRRLTNLAGFYGINEALFSSALAAMVFSTMAAQPLTIVGITGLISLFNYTIYDIIKLHDVTLYPAFMVSLVSLYLGEKGLILGRSGLAFGLPSRIG